MRDQLSILLNSTVYLRDPTLITRQGKPVAVRVSVKDWGQHLRMKAADQNLKAEANGQTAEY